ncbi:MAG: VanW family protein [Candidatus Peregrinibacteria bacterium]
MNFKHSKYFRTGIALTLGALCLSLSVGFMLSSKQSPLIFSASVNLPLLPSWKSSEVPVSLSDSDAALLRIAARLSRRLAKRSLPTPSISALVTAIREQHALMNRSVTVDLRFPDGTTHPWIVGVQTYPQWMRPEISTTQAHFILDTASIAETLTYASIEGIIRPVGSTLQETVDDGDVLRVISDGVAKFGYTFDVTKTTNDIANVLVTGGDRVSLPLTWSGGPIINATGRELGSLTILGSGRSDFSGSPAARIRNVQKAANDHLSNVLVGPGETFSFNATIGKPVTTGNGWYMAKIIIDGGTLVMAPGGGICQVSTTALRAALSAGFPIEKRANHSLYVSYYEKFGVGIDATVLPGVQDLTFMNDSSSWILIQSYDEGTEVVVNIYGTPDGRMTDIRGPYFADTDQSEQSLESKTIRSNEIAWVQEVSYSDGRIEDRPLISRYKGMPLSIPRKYALLHASAESGSTVSGSGI